MDRSELISRLGSNNNTILVCGLGITGIETALWLRREGKTVICIERLSREQYEKKDKFGRISELEKAGIALAFGVDGEEVATLLAGVTLAILSPGISLASALVGALRRANIPVVTELELGVMLARVPTIMVTGSNGKSTTVSLIHHLLHAAGKRSLLCGNVGTPIVSEFQCGEIERGLVDRFDWLVVEASSYQLEACESLAPDVGVLLNLSDNHLERHGSMERYRDAKLSMVLRQTKQQTVVINRDDSMLSAVAARLPGNLLTFGSSALRADANGKQVGATVIGSEIQVDLGSLHALIGTKNARLRGAHNRQNIAAACAALVAAEIDISNLQGAIDEFVPLEHRLEFVAMINGVTVLNDSKSTTVAASVAAIAAMVESDAGRDVRNSGSLVICVGGLAKAGSWSPLIKQLEAVQNRIRSIVCFGKDGGLIADHINASASKTSAIAVVIEPTVASAVNQALKLAAPGDVVLFTPGCASFDEFSDFEHRGREFKKAVLNCAAQSELRSFA